LFAIRQYRAPVGYGAAQPGAAAYFGQQAGLSGMLMGGYPQGGSCGCGSGSYYGGWGMGQMTGYYLGGALSVNRLPVYQNCVYQQASLNFCSHPETVTSNNCAKMWDVWFDCQDGQKTT